MYSQGLIYITRSQVELAELKRQNLKGYLSSRTHQNQLTGKRKSHGSSHCLLALGLMQSRSHSREKLLTWKSKSFVNKQTGTFNIQHSNPYAWTQKREKTSKSCFEVHAVSVHIPMTLFKSGPCFLCVVTESQVT
jgi:hypothetical protein